MISVRDCGAVRATGNGGGMAALAGGGTAVPWGRSVMDFDALEPRAPGTARPTWPGAGLGPPCDGERAGTPGARVGAAPFGMPRSGLARLGSAPGSSIGHSLLGLGAAARCRVSQGTRAAPDAGAAAGLERRWRGKGGGCTTLELGGTAARTVDSAGFGAAPPAGLAPDGGAAPAAAFAPRAGGPGGSARAG
jgi:hypothetical protein